MREFGIRPSGCAKNWSELAASPPAIVKALSFIANSMMRPDLGLMPVVSVSKTNSLSFEGVIGSVEAMAMARC